MINFLLSDLCLCQRLLKSTKTEKRMTYLLSYVFISKTDDFDMMKLVSVSNTFYML